ncbi:hypothetical protein FAUST_9497 [Fusarium austroamericanum]|uniref:Uncharacterized protein n=1 Tax=Fusarium austroamericanum TaxID=282268 RepID=A0AAN6BWB7_FUSAU|nr:hypothetical protein FAUST_9497 [Fusarium austroamericanum]
MTDSRETSAPKLISTFNQIKQDVAQCGQKLDNIQSPAQKHEASAKAIRAKLDAAWARIFQTKDLSERSQLQAEIQDHAGELKRLELSYRSGLTDAEAEYERQVDSVVRLCFKRLGESIHTMLGSQRSTILPQDFSNHSPHMNQYPQVRCPEEPRETIQNAGTHKRRRSSDVLDQQKHHRFTTTQGRKISKRSIHFQKVFQDGNALIKHIIVQWPLQQGSWYILRCEEHDLNFTDNPLIGAAAHIRSKKHGRKTSYFNTVVDLLGIEVLGCDESTAEKNYVTARAAFRKGHERVTTEDEQASESFGHSRDKGRTRGHRGPNERPPVVTDPKPGRIYRVYWKSSKQWLAALLLPMQNLQDIGIPDSIEGLGLLEDLPRCYVYDHESKPVSWDDEYVDDGPLVSTREFPVMFFDGSPFPSKSSVAWVSAGNLEIYDASAQNLIEHNQQVLEYLEARKTAEGTKTRDSSTNPDREQAQLAGCHSLAPQNQETPVNSQSDTPSIPSSTPLPSVNANSNKALSQHAVLQTADDTLLRSGHADQTPRDGSQAVTTSLSNDYPNDERPVTPATDPRTPVSPFKRQAHAVPRSEKTPGEIEVIRVAQKA